MSQQHRRRGLIEVASGTVAMALGLAAVAFVLFGPLYTLESSAVTSDGSVTNTFGSESLLQAGLDPITAGVLVLAMLASIGIGLGAIIHVRTRAPVGRGVVAIATVVLVVVAILGALSIGIFLLPSVALGFVTLAAGAEAASAAALWPNS